MNRKQLAVFLILLVVYAFCAFVTYAFSPINGFGRMVHPQFSLPIFASLSASTDAPSHYGFPRHVGIILKVAIDLASLATRTVKTPPATGEPFVQ